MPGLLVARARGWLDCLCIVARRLALAHPPTTLVRVWAALPALHAATSCFSMHAFDCCIGPWRPSPAACTRWVLICISPCKPQQAPEQQAPKKIAIGNASGGTLAVAAA